MTKTLQILKVFLGLKHKELKKAYFYWWFPFVTSIFIAPLFFYKSAWVIDGYVRATAKHYWMCVFAVFIFYSLLMFLYGIILLIIDFFKWLRDNWQKATKIVDKGE